MPANKHIEPFLLLSAPYNTIRVYMEQRKFKPDVEYRMSDFIIKHSTPEGLLCYSSLTGALVLIKDLEGSQDFLIAEHILVPIDEDEKSFVDSVRAKCKERRIERKPCSDYWILTTTSCNARCFYCFELGYKESSMSEDTAVRTARFIIENYTGKLITLHWYGGEPLVNDKAINTICHILKKAGVLFHSEITTNGYLLTSGLTRHALSEWNLQKVIVTVDGTEDVYNRTKAYVNRGSRSPFKVICENIDTIVDLGIEITIRTNIGLFNQSVVEQLYEGITTKYLDKENVTIYPHIVSNPPGGKLTMDSEQREQIYNIIRRIRTPWRKRKSKQALYDLPGFNDGHGREFSGEHLVIKPDGELAVNPDLFENDHFGSVYEGFHENQQRLAEYLVEKRRSAICTKCPIYPTCFKQEIAFNAEICTRADYKKCIETSERNMLNLYRIITSLCESV